MKSSKTEIVDSSDGQRISIGGAEVGSVATVHGVGKLFSIQYLRGIAALMVAYLHLLEQAPEGYGQHLYPLNFDSGRLKSGVDIFFVISGFIMLVSSQRSTSGDFAVRRFIRIVPLYWLLTLAVVALLLIHPAFLPRTTLSFGSTVKSLLFIPFSNPDFNGNMVPLLYPGWTLNFEMYFYVIFALILFVPFRLRLFLNGAVFFGLLGLRYLAHPSTDRSLLWFYTSPQIFEFWCGMIIGGLYLRGYLRFPRIPCVVAILMGFFILLFDWSVLPPPYDTWGNSTLVYMLPATLIVLSALALERVGHIHIRILTVLGDSSYSIYLSHIFFLGAARVLWHRVMPSAANGADALMFAIISMGLVVLGGLVVYEGLEKPMLNMMQSRYKKWRTQNTARKQVEAVLTV